MAYYHDSELTILFAMSTNTAGTIFQSSLDEISQELLSRGHKIVRTSSATDAKAQVFSNARIDTVLLEWEMPQSSEVLDVIRSRSARLPVLLFRDRREDTCVPVFVMEKIQEMVWSGEDSAIFIAGRIEKLASTYLGQIEPPFFRSLMTFRDVHEYSWHTPGHTGGTAFLKTASGRRFYDYFGENLLRSDLSISVDSLGSLLDHSGPIGESEKYIAAVFGADRSYSVTNGTSTSNRIVYAACVAEGDIVLCDRNAHKSIEQALTQTGANPVYLIPQRNYLGIIGPIPPDGLHHESLAARCAADARVRDGLCEQKPALATITNSTYDGICYNAAKVVELLGSTVDRIHFDEAWYGYARFNPLYMNHFAMYGSADNYPKDAPALFATQSTHKLLAAISQASYIHHRGGRNTLPHDRFNEAFMMHSSTSPLYTIIASNEIAAAMMDEAGEHLTSESIREAIEFRQNVAKYARELSVNGEGWFFSTWNPVTVKDPVTGKEYAFEDAPVNLLMKTPSCWTLHPGEEWHGYGNIEDDYAMLDPIKVSVVTPGINPDGTYQKTGIPAVLLSSYLGTKGIVNEKTNDFSVLFLFSIGITNGKWATLLSALLEFKRDYDANSPLPKVFPELCKAHPERYIDLGLRDLAGQIFSQMKKTSQVELQALAFSQLPEKVRLPRDAYRSLVHAKVEQVPLNQLSGRTLATGIVPYPPGIPLLMPGENAGSADQPFIRYLTSLQDFDSSFPGFTHDIHGVESINDIYHMWVVLE
ncbi:catabolic arginine decarboxylase [Trabulsiella guamensis ATCC 49490]|uniref:Catabolic arginine decarboxylase n=1 Tax=Trabulsiella guamensis ATCC 49490 TaxID=1005994 RepID=A0A085AA53_9ENTR|nr:Orn/Lys/Arg decarboxylase N-terminal domain-containing protein [Trabulsiella guamensis]KFC07098.1 catabolic arginine decarboxylase [Trabulsiella guamensis ATCC 49490]